MWRRLAVVVAVVRMRTDTSQNEQDCGGGVAHGEKEIVRRGDDPVHKHINNECKYAKGIGIGGGGKDRLQKEVWGKVRTDRILDCLKEMCDTDGERQKVVDTLKMQFKALDLTISVPKGGAGRGDAKAGAKVGAKSSVKSPTKSTAGQACLRKGCAFLANTNPAYRKEKDAKWHPYCCERCGRGFKSHGGWCQKKAIPPKVKEAEEAPLQLPPGIKACPACGMLIEKVGGDDNVMCGCEVRCGGSGRAGGWKESLLARKRWIHVQRVCWRNADVPHMHSFSPPPLLSLSRRHTHTHVWRSCLHTRMQAKAAGGTYEKALKGGGCGHQWNWSTLAPIDKGRRVPPDPRPSWRNHAPAALPTLTCSHPGAA